jgi:hypothetical protein
MMRVKRGGWSLRELAVACGRSVNTVNSLARQGLIPGYRGARSGIPRELGEQAALVLRNGAASPVLAQLLRSDPASALATGEAIAALARAQLELQESGKGEAA